MAVTIPISGTYLDVQPLENFLVDLFGVGKVKVKWKRGKFQCTIPRLLKDEEMARLRIAVPEEHYQQY